MSFSIPTVLSAAIAVVAVGGLLFVAVATDAGTAPGSGQRAFDAPGCEPNAYQGPGRSPRFLRDRNCPTPTPVIVARVARRGNGWRVVWDGSRSFDPVGERLIGFDWTLAPGRKVAGRTVSVRYRRPGLHPVVLYVTDAAGSVGVARGVVRLP